MEIFIFAFCAHDFTEINRAYFHTNIVFHTYIESVCFSTGPMRSHLRSLVFLNLAGQSY